MDTRSDDEILKELNDENISKYGLALVYTSLVMSAGILGNIPSIVFYGFKSAKTTTNVLITCLAATDLTACIVFIDEIIELCFTIRFPDRIGCKFMYFFNHWLVSTSVCMLVVIAVDRFRKICRPLHWQFTFTKVKLSVGGVFLFGFVLSLRDFAILDIVSTNITHPVTGRPLVARYCTHSKDPSLKTAVTISHMVDLFVFIVVVITLVVLYTIIAVSLWKYRKRCNLTTLQSRNEDEEQHDTTVTTVEVPSVSVSGTTDTKETPSSDSDSKMRNVTFKVESTECQTATKPTSDATKTGGDTDDDQQETFEDDDSRSTTTTKATQASSTSCMTNAVRSKPPRSKMVVQKKKALKKGNVERNVTIMMLVITAASILSFVPYFIVNLSLKRTSKTPEQEFNVGIQIALRSFILNNSINPYITGIFNPEFRRFIKERIKRIFCCTPFVSSLLK